MCRYITCLCVIGIHKSAILVEIHKGCSEYLLSALRQYLHNTYFDNVSGAILHILHIFGKLLANICIYFAIPISPGLLHICTVPVPTSCKLCMLQIPVRISPAERWKHKGYPAYLWPTLGQVYSLIYASCKDGEFGTKIICNRKLYI